MSKVQKYVVKTAFTSMLKKEGKTFPQSFKAGEEIDESVLNKEQIPAFLEKGYLVKGDAETVKQIKDEDNTLLAFRKIALILQEVPNQQALYEKIKKETAYFVNLYEQNKPQETINQEPEVDNTLPTEEKETTEGDQNQTAERKSRKGK